MKALRALKTLTAFSSSKPTKSLPNSALLRRFYSAQPQQDNPAAEDDATDDSVFDSAQYTLPNMGLDSGAEEVTRQPSWEEKYRAKANRAIFGEETQVESTRILEKEDEKRRRAAVLAKALLQAALRQPDEEEEEDLVVKEEDQKSLTVGIIGAPNAGKSALTNYMVCSHL